MCPSDRSPDDEPAEHSRPPADSVLQRKRDRELLALKTQAELSRGGEDPQPNIDGSALLRAVGAR